MMLPHLHEEEAVALPLLRAYFTPAEVGKLVQDILGNAPPVALGSFLYFMGGTRQACAKFMENEGIPFFVWYIAFKGHLQVYHERMGRHHDALLSGVPPVASGPSALGLVITLGLVAATVVATRRLRRYHIFLKRTALHAIVPPSPSHTTLAKRHLWNKVGCPSTPTKQRDFRVAWPQAS